VVPFHSNIEITKKATTPDLSRPYSLTIKDWLALPTSTTPPVDEIVSDPPHTTFPPVFCKMTGGN